MDSKWNRHILQAALLFFSFLGGACFVKYMRLPNYGYILFGVSIGIYWMIRKQRVGHCQIKCLVFAGIFAASLIFGKHIHAQGDIYNGLLYENYMTRPSWQDLFAWIVLSVLFAELLDRAVFWLEKKAKTVGLSHVYGLGSRKWWMVSAAILFVAWLPYLFVYYPGFIFGDSLTSISQAMNGWFNNHHPVLYTLFIKACLFLGIKIRNITFGCAIYTILQMLYLALCLGYQVSWLKKKGVCSTACVAVVAFYGFVPFFAQNSIAMWKDPIFSATIMVWSLMLIDYVLSCGKVVQQQRFFLVKHLVFLMIICFWRNNGRYVVLLFEAVLLFYWLFHRKKQVIIACKRMLISTGCCLLAVAIITGPVYQKLGINGEPVESLGIFLNQMARVAAYGGDMSDADREYMDGLLPLEKYPDTYRPCVVDRLKWDADFSQDFLNRNLLGFARTYISLFLKNPYCYAEAWMLNTFGYWAFNQWELNQDGNNIYKGNLDDINHWEDYGIRPHSLVSNKYVDVEKIIRVADPIIALAIITWLIGFLVFLIWKKRMWAWGIAAAPSVGLVLTLLIATPHAYWQRYGLAQYYLLPVYLLVACYLLGSKDIDECAKVPVEK